jgi:5-methylcytosine-specific restriction endonuclease McrA
MPRGKRIAFVGPLTENGQKSTKDKRELRKDIKELRKQLRHEARIVKGERIVNEKIYPKQLKRVLIYDSAKINTRQGRWLDENPYVLVAYMKKVANEELERKKDIARKGGHTRRLRILENGYSYYSLTQVLTTYGKNCHLCHEPINLKASRRVGVGDWLLGLHVDHLVSIAKGGPDTLENVRPSHAICNLKKWIG